VCPPPAGVVDLVREEPSQTRPRRLPDAGAPKLGSGCGKVNSAATCPCGRGISTVGRPPPLTRFDAQQYLTKLVSRQRNLMHRAVSNEADIQAPQPQAREQARVSGADEIPGWSRCAEPPPEKGSVTARRDGREQVGLPREDPGERLPRRARITRTTDIRALLGGGKRKRTRMLDVFLGASPVPFARVGVIVPKHGRTIVERNLLKRRLREVGRRGVLPSVSRQGLRVDVLIRARAASYRGSFAELSRDIREAVEELCSPGS
jgi:ribonuclease P protein component